MWVTVCEIISETCECLCVVLEPNYLSKPTTEEWRAKAVDFFFLGIACKERNNVHDESATPYRLVQNKKDRRALKNNVCKKTYNIVVIEWNET